MLEVGPNSKSLGNHVVRPEKRKRKGAVGRICRKKVFSELTSYLDTRCGGVA